MSEGEAREPPHGVSIEDHARISAEIAEGDRTMRAVLDANRLTEAAWNEATGHWMGRLAADVQEHKDRARLPHVYSDAYSKAQDALKPVPPMDASSYAALVVAIQASGDPGPPLAARALTTADYLRLSRHWARALSSDQAAAAAYFEAYQALQPAPREA